MTDTNLPAISRDEMEMQCKVLTINRRSMWRALTLLTAVDGNGQEERVHADVCFVAPEAMQGLIPSKCAVTDNDVRMLFYVNSTLPLAVRRFSEGMVVLIANVPFDHTLIYNIEDQLLIDPHFHSTGIEYVIVCSAKTAKSILLPSDWEAVCGKGDEQ